MFPIVDLHIHTNFSDGGSNIQDVLRKVKKAGINYFAITDHDTYRAMSPEVKDSLPQQGLPATSEQIEGVIEWNGTTSLRGVEYTFVHNGFQMHMIGLGIKYPDKRELDRCECLKTTRLERVIKLAEEVNRKDTGIYAGINVNTDELRKLIKDSVPSRYHLGYLIAKQVPGMTTETATSRYLGPHLEGYHIDFEALPDLRRVIELIHSLGGAAFLPHLGRNHLSGINDGLQEEIMHMYELGLDGVEIQSGRGRDAKIHSEYEMLVYRLNSQLGDKRKLLVSLGSDDHGKYDSSDELQGIQLHSGLTPMFANILTRIRENRPSK